MRLWRMLSLAVVLTAALFSTHCYSQSAPPVANAYTQEMHPITNYGAGAAINSLTLQTGANNGNVYIQFSLANIPAEASVQKATLQLYVNQVLGPGSFDVYQLNSEWSQTAMTYTNAPALGVSATGNNPVAIPATADQFILIDVTPLVQGWVNGTIPNNGLALSMTSSTGGALFDSKEAINTSHMPELQIVLNGPAGPQGPMGPAGPPGATSGTGPQVTVGTGFNFRNAFDPTATYSPYDVVTYNGSTYDALSPLTPGGATPDINTSWALMAQQGSPGTPGATGSTGPQGPIGLTGATGATGAQGTAGSGFNFRNAFDPAATYSPYDVVTYNGSTYNAIATVAPGGATPDINTSWALMAQQGAAGATGATGPQGPMGPAGPPGSTSITGPQGTVASGFNFRNAFDPTATYSPYDVVTYNGSTYDAVAAIAPGGATPDLNSSWAMLAQQGDKGAAGTAGPNSVSPATSSTIAGIIKGAGGALTSAIAGTDYVIPSGSITGNAATASQLSTTGSNGTFWGVSGGVQGFYQPGILQGLSQPSGGGGNCQAVTVTNGVAAVNWATSSCAVITANGSNVSLITLSNPSNGAAYTLGLCNDGSPRFWALPGVLKQASMPNYPSECVYKIYTYDGANYQGPGSTATPTVIYGSERSTPASSAPGAFVCWWDSVNHVMTCNENASGATANMVVPVAGANNGQFVSYIDSSGIQHMAQAAGGSGSGTVTTTGSPAAGALAKFSGSTSITGAVFSDIVAMWAGCSGTQYLGADGACHSPSGGGGSGGTVTSVAFAGDGVVDSSTPSTAVTTSGQVTATIINQSANTALRGPASGSAAAPSFRQDVIADLPAGTVYSVVPSTSSSDTLNCGTTPGITNNPVAFETTISRPAFTQKPGATWQLGISAIASSTASSLTFTYQIDDGNTVIYTSGPQASGLNTPNLPVGAIVNEQISGSNLASAALTVYPIGSVFSNYGQSALNRTAQTTGYNSNTSGTLSVLIQCSAATPGNSVTLTGLTLTKIY